MLLIRFSIAGVFVEHIRSASLNLRINDGLPNLTGFQGLATSACLFIFSIKFFEGFSPNVWQPWTFVRTEKCPSRIFDNSLHEEVRNPESIEKISGPIFFFSSVLFKIQELKDICVPRL